MARSLCFYFILNTEKCVFAYIYLKVVRILLLLNYYIIFYLSHTLC